MRIKTIAAMVMLLAVSAACMMTTDEGCAAAPSIEVTDGLGNTFTFDKPVDKVISIGVGVTATVIGVGALDKIVVCDNYSKKDKSPLFKDLQDLISKGKVAAGGNIYSSGKDQLWNDIINAADPETGSFDRDTDVVLVTGSNTYRANIVPLLEDKGFKNVLQWNDIKDYDSLIGFAETISKICRGEVIDEIRQMPYVRDTINSRIESSGVQKAKAFYVTYSSGNFKVGNTGSIATSMILAAGGDAVSVDPSQTATTYATNVTKLVEDNPGVVIFVDDVVVKDVGRMDELRKLVGDTTLVPLESIWNNYCLESMNGLWTIASAMYPDLFEGDVPEIPEEKLDSTVYIIAAVAVIAIVAVAAVFLMKRNA